MKIPIKSLAYAASICLVIAIALASFLIYELNARVQSLQGANRSLTSEVVTYKNKHGKLLTQKQAAEIRAGDLERLLPHVAESIRKDFDLKFKNLRAYVEGSFQASGSGNATITSIPYVTDTTLLDTPDYSVYQKPDGTVRMKKNGVWVTLYDSTAFEPFALVADDGYLNFKADVYSQFDAPYEYTYSDTVKYAFHMRGKWLQKKKLYATGMLSNKNARILNSEAVLVNEFRDRRWSVGPCISWGVDQHLQTNFTVGFSIQYSLIKF